MPDDPQPRAEGPYVTGLASDQMTALERQLTAELAEQRRMMVQIAHHCQDTEAELLHQLAQANAEIEDWKHGSQHEAESADLMRAVVEAARRWRDSPDGDPAPEFALYDALHAYDAAHAVEQP